MKKQSIVLMVVSLLTAASLTWLVPAAQAARMTAQKAGAVKQNLELSGSIVDGTRVINVTASKFKFNPSILVVKRGESVRIMATTADVSHGLAIKGYKINTKIDPGKTEKIEFVADKAGEFHIYCSVYCGAGHMSMTGKLVVVE